MEQRNDGEYVNDEGLTKDVERLANETEVNMSEPATNSLLHQTGLLKSWTDDRGRVTSSGAFRDESFIEFLDGTQVSVKDSERESWFEYRQAAYRAFRDTGLPEGLWTDERTQVRLLREWLLMLKKQTRRCIVESRCGEVPEVGK
jgi:hypothetical protein